MPLKGAFAFMLYLWGVINKYCIDLQLNYWLDCTLFSCDRALIRKKKQNMQIPVLYKFSMYSGEVKVFMPFHLVLCPFINHHRHGVTWDEGVWNVPTRSGLTFARPAWTALGNSLSQYPHTLIYSRPLSSLCGKPLLPSQSNSKLNNSVHGAVYQGCQTHLCRASYCRRSFPYDLM